MSIHGDSLEVLVFLMFASIVCYLWIKGISKNKWTFFFSIIFSFSFFLVVFKSGLVRHDEWHKHISFVFLALSSFLIAALTRSWILLRTSLVWALAVSYSSSNYDLYNFIKRPFVFYSAALSSITIQVGGKENHLKYNESLKILEDNFPFPEVEGSVDIYPYDQAYLIGAGKNWNPRPIFQSYAAYTNELVNKNAAHLRSNKAPESIVYSIKTIDGRYPLLDDGLSFVEIIKNYHVSSYKDAFLLLDRKEGEYLQIENFSSLIKSDSSKISKPILLPDDKGYYFVKLDFKKTIYGKVVSALYKPSVLNLIVNGVSGWKKIFRIVAGSASSGFIISPLFDSSNNFALGIVDANFNKHVAGFSIEIEGWPWVWERTYNYELYKLDFEVSHSLGDL